MSCVTHPEAPGEPCTVCQRGICEACAAWSVDGRGACETCGGAVDTRSRAIASAIFAFTAAFYLAALTAFVLVWKAQAFIGGLSAIAAIGFGRLLQVVVKPQVAVRRR